MIENCWQCPAASTVESLSHGVIRCAGGHRWSFPCVAGSAETVPLTADCLGAAVVSVVTVSPWFLLHVALLLVFAG